MFPLVLTKGDVGSVGLDSYVESWIDVFEARRSFLFDVQAYTYAYLARQRCKV